MSTITIAKTLENILDNPIVAASLDRSMGAKALVQEYAQSLERDLTARRPSPAYIRHGSELVYQGTDLDLYSLSTHLSNRRAVINIPKYENVSKSSLKSNQRVISNKNRHGQVLRPISNKKTHAFSILIMDFNVAEKTRNNRERVGAPRYFSLVDDYGNLSSNWSRIEWDSSPEEDKLIEVI